MVSVQSTELIESSLEDLIIPSEKVAHVQCGNPLEHALLVLVKSGYSSVPVLNPKYQLEGIISKSMILNQILGIERFETEKLSEITVEEVMNREVPTLKRNNLFLDGLKSVINNPFVCVVDDDGYFDGILTRRALLKKLTYYFHSIHHT